MGNLEFIIKSEEIVSKAKQDIETLGKYDKNVDPLVYLSVEKNLSGLFTALHLIEELLEKQSK